MAVRVTTSTAAACLAPPTRSATSWSPERQPGNIVATRQIIRFVSLASLSTGPALSDFEMSFEGRNWAKLGKKLLQGIRGPGSVTPLANQLVSPTDSVMGHLLQPGWFGLCRSAGRGSFSRARRQPGKPGLVHQLRRPDPQGLLPAHSGRTRTGISTGATPTASSQSIPISVPRAALISRSSTRLARRSSRALLTRSTTTFSPLPQAPLVRPTPTSSPRWKPTCPSSSGCRYTPGARS